MHPLFFLFSFFFSWPPQQLSSSIPILSPNRRILHEPFVPLDSLPPSEPPNQPQPQPPFSPPILPFSTSSNPNPNPKHPFSNTSNPNPKHPFSTTSNPNPNQPFSTTTPDQSSPFFPFYPYPPPPPPPSFSTFASFPANISSLVVPHSLEPKKSSSSRILSVAITAVACTTIMVAISVFVYRRRKHYIAASNKTLTTQTNLGLFPPNAETETTNRNQRLRHNSSTTSEFLYIGTVVDSHRIDDATDSDGSDGQKMESPELQPLPRLAPRQHYSVQPPQAQVNEDHEEFFSPKGSSLCASESSGVNGLGSWRVLPEQSGELSSSSYSSGSPLPNSSPGGAQLESSSSSGTRTRRSLSSTSTLSSEIKNDALSETTLLENEDELPKRVSNDSNGTRESLAPASSSAFSLPSSPEKAMHCDSLDQSPRMSGLSSVPLSPTLLSSPEREMSHIWNESENFTNCVSQRKQQHWEIPVFSIPTGPSHRVSLSLPPSLPTPPPPLFPRRKQWSVSAIPAPVVGQPVSRPPELTPPSRPFVLLNNPTTNVSTDELPLSSQNYGSHNIWTN